MKMIDLNDWVGDVLSVQDLTSGELFNKLKILAEAARWHRAVSELYCAEQVADEALRMLQNKVKEGFGNDIRTRVSVHNFLEAAASPKIPGYDKVEVADRCGWKRPSKEYN